MDPAGISTPAVADCDAVESDRIEGSLLVNVTNTAVGDAADRATGNNGSSPGFNVIGVRIIVGPAGTTVVGSIAIAAAEPPPDTAAVLVTLGVGALAATFTLTVIGG